MGGIFDDHMQMLLKLIQINSSLDTFLILGLEFKYRIERRHSIKTQGINDTVMLRISMTLVKLIAEWI